MARAVKIIKKAFVWLIIAFTVCMVAFTLLSFYIFNRTDRSLFGYRVFVVLNDSMSATDFSAGDIIFIKKVGDLSKLKPGEIITFISQNDATFGQTVTHKIRRLTVDEKGNPGFVTYGTTNDVDDETVVTYPFVIGKYQSRIPKIGAFFRFLKTVPGYVTCILLPFLLLIVWQGVNCIRLFSRYKFEQMQEMQAKCEELEAERAESQKLMAELLELKDPHALYEANDSVSSQ